MNKEQNEDFDKLAIHAELFMADVKAMYECTANGLHALKLLQGFALDVNIESYKTNTEKAELLAEMREGFCEELRGDLIAGLNSGWGISVSNLDDAFTAIGLNQTSCINHCKQLDERARFMLATEILLLLGCVRNLSERLKKHFKTINTIDVLTMLGRDWNQSLN